MKRILINSGLLLLILPSLIKAGDKKEAAAKAASTKGAHHLQPPATPQFQPIPAAMPPATPASAATATASTNRSSPTTATSQQTAIVAKVAAASQQPAEWEARSTPRLGNYLVNKNQPNHFKAHHHGRGSVTSMDFGHTWVDSQGNQYSIMGHSIKNPPKPPQKKPSAQKYKITPSSSSSSSSFCCCGSSNDVEPFSI